MKNLIFSLTIIIISSNSKNKVGERCFHLDNNKFVGENQKHLSIIRHRLLFLICSVRK